jgi:chemotaxis protein MotB
VAVKQKCPEFENHERWLVSFADMMTLLFALFVVLFALKQGGQDAKIEQASMAVSEAFNQVLEDIPIERRIGPQEAGLGIFEHFRGNQARPPLIKKYPGAEEKIKVIDQEMKVLNAQIEDRLYGPERRSQVGDTGSERIVSIHRTADGIQLRLLAAHFYDAGTWRIKRSSEPELDKVAEILRELGRTITIEGHTDNSDMKGDMTNWELSALRASGVVRYLITKHNFSPQKIIAAGYGDTRPIADNRTAAGRALNRRIEIRIHYND